MLKPFAFASVAALAVSACGLAHGNSSDHNSPKTTQTYALSGFESVALKGSDDVRVLTGATFAVSASGRQKVLDDLDIRVENGVLIVSRKDRNGWHIGWNDDEQGAVVTVTLPLLREASLMGSGDLSVDSTAEDKFAASLAGSGDLSIANARAADTTLSIAGSGDLRAKGKATNVSLSLAGSGDMDASALESQTLSVSLAGSGDIKAHTSGKASGSIVGTQDCSISKTGSGDVVCG
jgi:Putative auto-transporter adhesin, head GIN domain